MSDQISVGVVGYGYMGEIRRRVVESDPALALLGVCETDPVRREGIAGTQAFDSYVELLDAGPDAVFVCTPNRFSPEITVDALNRGMHVFCEKPPGRTVSDVHSMREAESANPDARLMFGFNHRFHPGILKGKVLVESGRLGRVLSLRGIYGKSGGLGFRGSWRNDAEMSGGGILLDQGIHMLDLFRYFCGDFERVKAFTADEYWKTGLEDNAWIVLKNDAGLGAMLHSSATLWKHTFKLDVICEDGYLVIEGLLSKTGSYGREQIVVGRRQFEDESEALGNPSEEVTYFDRDASWELEVAEWVRCIREDAPVTTSNSHDALRVMEIIEAAYRDAAGEGSAS
jgi:predicted dehydrogenase